MILRIIGYKFGKNNRMFTRIIKELLETKIAECYEILPNIKMMNMKAAR